MLTEIFGYVHFLGRKPIAFLRSINLFGEKKSKISMKLLNRSEEQMFWKFRKARGKMLIRNKMIFKKKGPETNLAS